MGIIELIKFEEQFQEYEITVYQSLACEYIMSEGHVDTPKQINLLYDDVERQYLVILNLMGVPWRYGRCVKNVTKGVGETLRK